MPAKPDTVATGTRRSRWSLARQLVILQVALVIFALGAAAIALVVDADQEVEGQAGRRCQVIASTIADMPAVVQALGTSNPTEILQPIAVRVQVDTGVDFVTIMSADGIRYTHRDPAQIGKQFLGNIAPSLRGENLIETYTGTLGESVRSVVPIRSGPDGPIIALVSVGVTLTGLDSETYSRILALAVGGVAVLALALVGTWLIGRRVDRVTHQMGPAELGLMYEHYDAVLHSVREGLLLLDNHARVALMNSEARRLLDLPEAAIGQPITQVGLPADLVEILAGEIDLKDDVQVAGDRVLVVNSAPSRSPINGKTMGRVVTLRDHTDLTALTSELGVAKDLTEALKSQAHEAANRLHVVIGLVENGNTDQAIAFATDELQLAQRLNDQVVGAVSDPLIAAVLLGKAQTAAERGVELVVSADSALDVEALGDAELSARDVVTVLTNLIDNATDAVAGQLGATIVVTVRRSHPDQDELLIKVSDNGPGVSPETLPRLLTRGFSTKPGTGTAHGRGLGLALVNQVVHRYGGAMEVENIGGACFSVTIGREPGTAKELTAAKEQTAAREHTAAKEFTPAQQLEGHDR